VRAFNSASGKLKPGTDSYEPLTYSHLELAVSKYIPIINGLLTASDSFKDTTPVKFTRFGVC